MVKRADFFRFRIVACAALAAVVAIPAAADDTTASDRVASTGPVRRVQATAEIPASPEAVWKAWTTVEGVRQFMAPDARIELRQNGPYEILFNTANPAGLQGTEGQEILAFEPQKFLSFTWNNPPRYPGIRNQRTVVSLYFEPVGTGATRVTLVQSGWGLGDQWDSAFSYFSGAWPNVVLARLKDSFVKGPIDWTKVGPSQAK